MAKLISTIFSSMRGSIAGTTFLTTPAGQIIGRQRTKPVQTPTTYRTYIKDALIEMVAVWNSLNASERQKWNDWAAANPPGSGRHQFLAAQAFQRFGDLLSPTGWTAIIDHFIAPEFNGHPSFTLQAIPYLGAGNTGITVSVKNTAGKSCHYLLEISPGLSPARNYWKGPWLPAYTLGDVIAGGATAPTDFDGLTAGLKYFVRVRALSTDTNPPLRGRAISPALIVSSIAITAP